VNIRFIHSKESTYFGLSILASVLVYFMLFISIIGIFYGLLGIAITFILHGLMVGHIRSNGVKLTTQQFPEVHRKVAELCERMNIKKVPDVFILQSDGILNAFATRFFGRNFVVLYSNMFELVDSGDEDELSFVIAHELAHIQRNHMTKNLLVLPAKWIPFLGKAYSRACEYTCDAIAAAYTNNKQSAIRGLTMLAIGRIMFKKVNVEDYLSESGKEKGFYIWFSHITATHPPLPIRIRAIERLDLHEYSMNISTSTLITEGTEKVHN
jgi:Zn-dependent protease with chaperone function